MNRVVYTVWPQSYVKDGYDVEVETENILLS